MLPAALPSFIVLVLTASLPLQLHAQHHIDVAQKGNNNSVSISQSSFPTHQQPAHEDCNVPISLGLQDNILYITSSDTLRVQGSSLPQVVKLFPPFMRFAPLPGASDTTVRLGYYPNGQLVTDTLALIAVSYKSPQVMILTERVRAYELYVQQEGTGNSAHIQTCEN